MSEIKRYDIDLSDAHHVARHDGKFVLHSDHVAARAADKAEIERLRLSEWHWQQQAEKAEARIAELETQIRKLNQADSQVNDSGLNSKEDEAVLSNSEMRQLLEGVPQDAIAGGWTARGLSAYAKFLENQVAEPDAVQAAEMRRNADRYQLHCRNLQVAAWMGIDPYAPDALDKLDSAIDAAIAAAKSTT